MTIYLDDSNVGTERCSPGDDSHVDEAILTWPWATVANWPAAFSAPAEVMLHPGATAGCCAAVPNSAPGGPAHSDGYGPAEQPAGAGGAA